MVYRDGDLCAAQSLVVPQTVSIGYMLSTPPIPSSWAEARGWYLVLAMEILYGGVGS